MDATTALTAAFADFPDPRRDHGKVHRLIDILVIAVCATFAGADSLHQIAGYGSSKEEWLRGFLELPGGIPSHDTFLRVLGKIDPREFQKRFAGWLGAVCRELARPAVAVDGKAVRAAKEATATGCLTLVNAWETTRGLALGQVAVPAGSSEKAVWTELLEFLDLAGAVVTLDAGGCTRAVAEKIAGRGGDYLLAVKGNQKGLYAAVGDLLTRGLETDFAGMEVECHDESNSGHGRTEQRYTTVIRNPAGLPKAWADAACVVAVSRDRKVGDAPATHTLQFYVAGFAAPAEEMAGYVRGHWGIENAQHWTLDVAFREDENKTAGRAGQNLAWMRRFALSLLKAEPSKQSMAHKRLRCAWDNDYLIKVLGISA